MCLCVPSVLIGVAPGLFRKLLGRRKAPGGKNKRATNGPGEPGEEKKPASLGMCNVVPWIFDWVFFGLLALSVFLCASVASVAGFL